MTQARIPHCVTGITLPGSFVYDRPPERVVGAADRPHPRLARRLTDVKDNRDAAAPHGMTTGRGPGASRDEQGEVTA